jgi:hypothetical protein
MAIVRIPSKETHARTLEPYLRAVGSVAYHWNHLQEALGYLFARIINVDHNVGLAVWHALTSDRSQREILKAAAKTAKLPEMPKFEADVSWLLKEVDILANQRNDALHAPCIVTSTGLEVTIYPAIGSKSPRAKSMWGKEIMKELVWYESKAKTLTIFADKLERQITRRRSNVKLDAWPERPLMPTLGQNPSHKE